MRNIINIFKMKDLNFFFFYNLIIGKGGFKRLMFSSKKPKSVYGATKLLANNAFLILPIMQTYNAN